MLDGIDPDFWTIDRLRKESWRFEGVRDLPGKTYVRDEQGKVIGGPYRLCKGDIDSDAAYEKYKHLLEDDLLDNTYVTKTRKQHGYHFDWLEDWDEKSDFVSINHGDCKSEETLFEIMVGLQYTQVAGHHRYDSTFYYEQAGCRNLKKLGIMVRNGFYNKQVNEIVNDLLSKPNEIITRRRFQQIAKDPFHRGVAERERVQNQDGDKHLKLDDWQIDSVGSWAGKLYGVNGHSYFFMRSFLGTLARKIVEESGIEIINRITDDKNDLQNRSKWYGLLRDAYQDIQDGLHVEGRPTLVKVIERSLSIDEKKATRHVNNLIDILLNGGKIIKDIGKSNSSSSGNNVLYDFISANIPNHDYIRYIIHTIQKTVKRDSSLVKLITYTGLSAYTDDPLNLAILAPTSEGKTHPVEETIITTFPNRDVWKVGTSTPKVIIRQKSILVDEDNQPIQDKVNELKKRIKICKDKIRNSKKAEEISSNSNELDTLESQLENLIENAKYRIDLRNKIYVFLEPPRQEMWDILKPILSHDSLEIEHPYVYEVPGTGYDVKKIVTIGRPAFIFCSAKNQAKWEGWEEIASRCIVTSPNMAPEKYHESNFLIAQKKSLPKSIQQKVIVSDKEKDLARKCVLYIKSQLVERKFSTSIPYGQILGDTLPSEKGTDMRATRRIFSLLNIIPLLDLHFRPKLVRDEETLVIATLSDLEEVIKLILDTSAVPTWKMKLFREVFCRKYREVNHPLTIKEICEAHKEYYNKKISTPYIREHLISEWLAGSLIDEEMVVSVKEDQNATTTTTKKTKDVAKETTIKTYYPLVEVDAALRPIILAPKIPDNWLASEILLSAYVDSTHQLDLNLLKFYNIDGSPMKVIDFITEYNGDCKLTQFLTYESKNSRDYKHIADLQILGEHDALTNSVTETPRIFPVLLSHPQIEPHLPNGAQFESIENISIFQIFANSTNSSDYNNSNNSKIKYFSILPYLSSVCQKLKLIVT
jgi:hypothetical protein